MSEATELAALKAARNSGVLTVKHGDTLTTYRSLSEIERIIAAIEASIGTTAGTRVSRVRPLYQSGKGL